jgi:HAE1 family hydrophobic/amphiphilic exporter-1
MLCSRLFKKKKDDGHHGSSKDSRFFRPIDSVYTRMLHWSMAHRKSVVALCVIVVIAIVPMFMVIGKNFVPEDDQGAFEVSLRSPEDVAARLYQCRDPGRQGYTHAASVTDTLTRSEEQAR